MSQTIVPASITPKPNKPWAASKKDRIELALQFIAAALISFGVVAATAMKGKLAYVAIFFFAFIIIDFIVNYLRRGAPAAKDAIFRGFVTAAVFIAVTPIVSILLTVVVRGYKGIHPNIFLKDMHSNTVNDAVTQGGLVHAIVGTVLMVVFAMIISVPIGILTAIYLTEIKGRFARPIKFLVQAMSGVPSIVAGLFILAAIVYPFTKNYNGIEGSLALAILMIPTVARTSEEVLLLIPGDLREAGVALGGTQWRTVMMVVVPAARSGLITAMILGVARIAGETAPLVLLTGGGDTTNYNMFKGPMGSLPYYIWKGFNNGTDQSVTRAWAGILVLLAMVLILFGSARYLGNRKVGK